MPSLFRSLTARLVFCAVIPVCAVGAGESGDAAQWGVENLAGGKYKEAVALLEPAFAAAQTPAARRPLGLVLVDADRIVGHLKEAREVCATLLKDDANDTDVKLLNAELDAETGRYKEARDAYDALLKAQSENHRAWALRSIVLRLLGDDKGLKATADHFFDLYSKNLKYYNSDEVKDPREIAYIGIGIQDENPKSAFETGFMLAEDLAKTKGLQIPETLLWSARLAQSVYSFANADKRYAQVLQWRPKLPDALAGRAAITYQATHKLDDVEKMLTEALAINPHHIEAHLLWAKVALEEERYDDAKKHLDTALEVNPNHLLGLAMRALYFVELNRPDEYAKIEARMKEIKPICPDFYCDVAEMMENKRGFNTAAPYYKKAIEIAPEYWRGYYGLGMNTSRQGAFGEEEGKTLLLKAFGKNRFNVWCNNMIKVLDRFIGDKEQEVKPVYSESKTKHFTLKFFGKEADIVRPYLEEWAEAAYEKQAKMFHYEPEGPLSIELCFSFQDQAARTVGLPNLGALGVCFGKLCTVVSPREGGHDHPPFNWRKVIEHEFGHVMVLQLSNFRVPRWYTEAFSTYLEDDSRIQSDHMMIDALARNEIRDIDKMNGYFRGNMLMAYVHGRYVIEYIDKTFGFDAHIKAIKLFAQGKNLEDALKEATGKSIAELNKGQLEFVKNAFKDVRLRPTPNKADVAKLELATAVTATATATDLANLAIAYIQMRRFEQAKVLAQRALAKDERCVDALNILGSLAYEAKEYEEAKQLWLKSTGIDPARSFNAWHKLGVLYKKEGKTTKAIEAFENARKAYPRYVGEDSPYHELPGLYAELEPPQLDKALQVWRDAVHINTEDKEAAFEGLKLAVKLKDPKTAVFFAEAHVAIDPYVLEVHTLASKAYEEIGDMAHAAREMSVAAAIEPTSVDAWVGVARLSNAAGKKDEARAAIQKAADIDNTRQDVKDLLKALGGK